MIDGCRKCGKLYETTMEDAYDPRPEIHLCKLCWDKEAHSPEDAKLKKREPETLEDNGLTAADVIGGEAVG